MQSPIIKLQDGPQKAFSRTLADIAIFGGSAGSGKTYSLLAEPLRHYFNPFFGAVFFRRNSVQIRNQGGMWHEAQKMYSPLGARMQESFLQATFPTKMRVKFSHLEYESSVYDWQGSQIPLIGWDELTSFLESQFFYMMSRNRSTSGVAGYMRATCNPDADSWVRRFIDPWIGEDGFPIAEMSGILRWFIRLDDQLIWAEHKEQLIEKYGDKQLPKSVTFIPSKLTDNKILMEADPAYLSNLMALPRVERMRLLEGNWNVRPSAGEYFQRSYFEIIEAIPAGWNKIVRYWDRAATKPNENNKDPDYSAGLLMYSYPNGTCVVADVRRLRDTPLKVEEFIKNTASQDKNHVKICLEQDPGSSGVADADNYVRLLRGYDVRVRKVTKDKVTRALPVSAQAERGNIKILRGKWNEDFLRELENFPAGENGHDDQVDVFSGAYNEFNQSPSILDVL